MVADQRAFISERCRLCELFERSATVGQSSRFGQTDCASHGQSASVSRSVSRFKDARLHREA